MIFESALLPGTLIRRFQRFTAEVRLDAGETVLAHCPNSGSMKGVCVPGAPVLLSHHPSPHRRLQYTWEMIRLEEGWIGINTMVPNRLVAEELASGDKLRFYRYRQFQSEVKIADDTRIDFALGRAQRGWLEVKNVTLVDNHVALFPDSVTMRGSKHLQHLISHIKRGGRSIALFIIQHPAGERFAPADEIDPEYGRILRQAFHAGVRVEAWKANVSPQGITLDRRVPVIL